MIIHPDAAADIADAYDWYESQRDGLGDEFQEDLERVFRRITALPESYRVVHRDVRRALLKQFPYSVYYRIENQEVVIRAVVHSRRDPSHWKERLQ